MQGKQAVVVGGGKVAERKALSLLKAGASVTIVSPDLSKRLMLLAEKKQILHIDRPYRKKDIKGAFVVIAATDSPEINARISGDAACLVNVVDVPPLCNFIAPSVVQRGPLTIAVSTSGASPALARTIRHELEGLYGPEVGAYLKFLSTVRKKALGSIKDQAVREGFLKSLASAETLQSLRSEGLGAVRGKVLRQLASLTD